MSSFTAAPFPGAFGPGFGPNPFTGRRSRRRPQPPTADTPWVAMDDGEHDEPRRGRGGHRHGHGGRGFGPGGPFGPDFGPGGPFGPGFGPGRGRGRARRGDVRAALLALLAEQPRHGYDLIQEIAARTDGRWRPSAGAVYPALALLEDEGLVRAREEEGRKVFHLTDSGRAYVDEHADELQAPWTAAAAGMPESAVQTFELARQVASALQEVVRTGTPEQVAKAQALLSDTRRALYRILADEPEAPAH